MIRSCCCCASCPWNREPFDSLRQRTGFSVKHLAHDLSCLYYATAITTTQSRSGTFAVGRDSYLASTGPGLDSLPSSGSTASDLTAPALLERRPSAPKSTPAPS